MDQISNGDGASLPLADSSLNPFPGAKLVIPLPGPFGDPRRILRRSVCEMCLSSAHFHRC